MNAREWDLIPDEELVRRAQRDPGGAEGREAESRLFSRYRDRLYAWCYRHTRDREQALDLAQNAMLAAHRGLDAFEGRARFSSWLFAIARYQHLDSLRRPRLLLDEDAELDSLESPVNDPARQFERKDEEDRLLALVQRVLEPTERIALWLRCVECKAVDEITRLLDLENETGARALLQRARRKLRLALESGDTS
jgi:RNA polymerase sigma-70 factor (ECF subfamily)